ncbi:hypothetical protein [Jeotgalibacillus proteolyticus]|uniref:Spore coat protein n=1 Tax=Jeotgalibacillus proteolyticus TaxID=2082395 RepID=A0A2S5GBU6_9BACL|nr:hypothetical protein [Jeotgalibacillus proteolyticus]PPA70385.1 hypothetical protein C4B60_12470 [Jeotgalibacillus proteolyticus]
MARNGYAVHEILEVHEMITIKSASVAKSTLMRGLASDKGLKDLLQEDAETAQKAVKELSEVIEKGIGS